MSETIKLYGHVMDVKKLEDLEQKSQKQQEEINKLYDLIGAKKKK